MNHRNLGIWDIQKKSEFWKILAERKNGDFKIITTVSKDLNRLELTFEYDKIIISFSESDTKPLFVECSIRSEMEQAWFEISKIDFIGKISGKFSKSKITSINSEFNNSYLIKGTDSYIIRSIINNKNITDLILKQNLTFIGGEQGKNGKFNLSLNIHRNINNIEQLEVIYNLTTMLIDLLKRKRNSC